MNKIKNGFKIFIAIIIVLGSFNSVTAMEEEKKEYKVISQEQWQEILKDDALRDNILRKKIKELIEITNQEECTLLRAGDLFEFCLKELGCSRVAAKVILQCLKQNCHRCIDGCQSILTYAVRHYHIIMSYLLILAGSDINGGEDKDTPLYEAVRSNSMRKEKVELLLNVGANVNLLTWGRKETALHAAVREKKVEIVELLLAWGADQTIENKYEDTPLDLARNEGCQKIIEILQHWKKHEQD